MEVGTSNLGPVFEERVAQAHHQVRLGEDSDYDLVYAHFDMRHYLLQSPNAAERRGVDLVDHYLRVGADLGKSPHPDFSGSAYLARYPERESSDETTPYLEWLKRGRDAGEIADPAPGIFELAPVLGLDPREVADLVRERRADLRERLLHGELGEMFARAVEIEPLIGAAWPEMARPRLIPFTHAPVTDQIAALHAAQRLAGFRRARLVFVVNRPRWGGGRRMEGHIAHALVPDVAPEDIVVVYTDAEGSGPAGRFPSGVREIHLARLVEGLEPEEAEYTLVTLLRSFGAEAIVNVNSRLLYHSLRVYGRALATSERLFLVFFCNEQTALGIWRGWSLRYFYRTFDLVAGVITDSHQLAEDLRRSHRISDEAMQRVHVFSAPIDRTQPVVSPALLPHNNARPQVFWAGRLDRQKRIDLFLRIARALPEVDFRMWGESVLGGGRRWLPRNVTAMGPYAQFADLPLHEADLWLYTSAWDGVPSLLLEVAMTGIPLVGTRVGGTGEVLDKDAWAIDVNADAEEYVLAIRSVLADPASARARALALRERLLRDRSQDAFAGQVRRVLLPSDEESGQ